MKNVINPWRLPKVSAHDALKAPHDPVNHPPHYTSTRFELMELVEDLGLARGFCLGNCLKYVKRAGLKTSSTEVEDLKKARWYLDRWISNLERRDVTSKDDSPCS
jgi:hypothetical protein